MRIIRSFQYAFTGIQEAFRFEKNFKIQVTISIIAIVSGFFFQISSIEWMALFLCCAIVLSLELINSAIEKLCNFVSPGVHPAIKKIKDYSAGAVLIASFFSTVIGLFIFLPKVYALIGG